MNRPPLPSEIEAAKNPVEPIEQIPLSLSDADKIRLAEEWERQMKAKAGELYILKPGTTRNLGPG